MSASFAGAPSQYLTIYGALPRQDSALVTLEANTALHRRTRAFLRYDGDISTYDSSHALSIGLRVTW